MSTPAKPFVKGFKFPIYPTPEQIELLDKTFGCCRKVYNVLLAQTSKEYDVHLQNKKLSIPSNAPNVSGYGLVNRLPLLKRDPELHYLKEVSSVALQQSILHLGAAYQRFFDIIKKNKGTPKPKKKKKPRKDGRPDGYPRFKSKHDNRQSFTLMANAFSLDENHHLIIAKCDTAIKVVYSQELPSAPTSCTITRNASGKYHVSFTCQYIPKKTSGTGTIGIDLGLTTLATLSTGEKVGNPRHFKRIEQRLRRLQKSLARKKKGSANYEKARIAQAKLYAYSANCRSDHLHKLSRRLVNENQVIGMEDLVIPNMVKNPKLAKSISDAAWGSLGTKLRYKCEESQHAILVKVDTYFPSSHLCHNTGLKLDRKLSLKERRWDCPYCGELHDRDLTAAINVHKEALRLSKKISLEAHAGQIVPVAYGTTYISKTP